MSHPYRVKCSNCQEVLDVTAPCSCPRCGAPLNLQQGGIIQLYRMGHPIGIAAGFGIYLNGQPFGHIGNKQSLLIPVPFGTYNIHITCGAVRRCRDLVVTLTPQAPHAFVKARMIPGFWTNSIGVEPAHPSEMP